MFWHKFCLWCAYISLIFFCVSLPLMSQCSLWISLNLIKYLCLFHKFKDWLVYLHPYFANKFRSSFLVDLTLRLWDKLLLFIVYLCVFIFCWDFFQHFSNVQILVQGSPVNSDRVLTFIVRKSTDNVDFVTYKESDTIVVRC